MLDFDVHKHKYSIICLSELSICVGYTSTFLYTLTFRNKEKVLYVNLSHWLFTIAKEMNET